MSAPDEVLEYIATRITSNIRELEGALIRVTAFASLNRQAVDFSLAEVVLKDLVPTDQPVQITLARIQAETAAYYAPVSYTHLDVYKRQELDTVAHCGHTLKGEFLRTLTGTDPVPGWTMLRTIRHNAFIHIHGGLEWITKHAPIPVTGVDFDNGSEFMNWAVITWCDKQAIPVTRSRPYKHNDNAHVEQRNGDWVRRHAFRYRYETDAELALLNELWDLVMARKNHLLPCVKATGWDTTPAGRKKRTYDKPRTCLLYTSRCV